MSFPLGNTLHYTGRTLGGSSLNETGTEGEDPDRVLGELEGKHVPVSLNSNAKTQTNSTIAKRILNNLKKRNNFGSRLVQESFDKRRVDLEDGRQN